MLLCTYVNLKNQFFISSSLSILSSSLSLQLVHLSHSIDRGWFLSPFSAVVADKMGCGGFGFAGVGMVVVGLGLSAWVWGLWVVAVVEEA